MAQKYSASDFSKVSYSNLFLNSNLKLLLVVIVIIPATIAFVLLFLVAEDQYYSDSIFTVDSYGLARNEAGQPEFRKKVGPQIGVLQEFVKSQRLVDKIFSQFDLVEAFSKGDFLFGISEQAPIELFMHYWQKMVSVSVDSDTGVARLRVYAFSPQDAQSLADLVLKESTAFLNDISLSEESELLSSAQKRLNKSISDLKVARGKVREFRKENRVFDGTIQGQNGVIEALQLDLSRSLIERASLEPETTDGKALDRRIAAIRWQIENAESNVLAGFGVRDELENLDAQSAGAQEAYKAALIGKDEARLIANQKRFSLNIHTSPTLPQTSHFPNRTIMFLTVLGCSLAIWAIAILIYHNIEDRG